MKQLILALLIISNVCGPVAGRWSVPAKGYNVAYRKPTKQSSNLYGYNKGYSELAVDGNTDSNFYHGSCTHTKNEFKAWWMVDLKSSYNIYAVKLFNRKDVPERLSNFRIEVSSNLFSWSHCYYQSGGLNDVWELFHCQASP
ncbi:unnamed protein product [Owenia fusiformis]|uniref:Fucolectin tachylectin-4 pentraxin-1 domain-containing protein n=1 Tax=Owenia fusiformis TaxID=6347 RepID=A0A8S4NX78_OWEFU|nr:unnamed protein product [Owenia fusiformis]